MFQPLHPWHTRKALRESIVRIKGSKRRVNVAASYRNYWKKWDPNRFNKKGYELESFIVGGIRHYCSWLAGAGIVYLGEETIAKLEKRVHTRPTPTEARRRSESKRSL